MRRTCYGFTLIELMAIIAIMGVLTTVAVISFSGGKGSTQMFAAARDVMATVRRARSTALVTMKPVVVEYSNESDGEGTRAKITIKAEKLFSSSAKSEPVYTLAGERVQGDEDEAATEEGEEQAGETLEDMLTPDAIPADVLEGMKLKVLNENEQLQLTTTYRSSISIFSTADNISRTYGGDEVKKTVDKAEGVDEATESPVKVVFAVNGTVDPAHKIWVYPEESTPEKGICIEVDRFGDIKCSDMENF